MIRMRGIHRLGMAFGLAVIMIAIFFSRHLAPSAPLQGQLLNGGNAGEPCCAGNTCTEGNRCNNGTCEEISWDCCEVSTDGSLSGCVGSISNYCTQNTYICPQDSTCKFRPEGGSYRGYCEHTGGDQCNFPTFFTDEEKDCDSASYAHWEDYPNLVPGYEWTAYGGNCSTEVCGCIDSTNAQPPSPDPFGPACSLCGNGEPNNGEECDDGNTTNGDGCSSACETEDDPCGTVNAEILSPCSSSSAGLQGSANSDGPVISESSVSSESSEEGSESSASSEESEESSDSSSSSSEIACPPEDSAEVAVSASNDSGTQYAHQLDSGTYRIEVYSPEDEEESVYVGYTWENYQNGRYHGSSVLFFIGDVVFGPDEDPASSWMGGQRPTGAAHYFNGDDPHFYDPPHDADDRKNAADQSRGNSYQATLEEGGTYSFIMNMGKDYQTPEQYSDFDRSGGTVVFRICPLDTENKTASSAQSESVTSQAPSSASASAASASSVASVASSSQASSASSFSFSSSRASSPSSSSRASSASSSSSRSVTSAQSFGSRASSSQVSSSSTSAGSTASSAATSLASSSASAMTQASSSSRVIVVITSSSYSLGLFTSSTPTVTGGNTSPSFQNLTVEQTVVAYASAGFSAVSCAAADCTPVEIEQMQAALVAAAEVEVLCSSDRDCDTGSCLNGACIELSAAQPLPPSQVLAQVVDLPFTTTPVVQPPAVTAPAVVYVPPSTTDSGPEALAIMASGAAAGYAWMRRRRVY
jgi:cysteine-rich repeat protein